MMSRLFFGLLCCFLAINAAFAQSNWQSKIDPEVLAELQAGAEVVVIVEMAQRPDFSGAYALRGKEAKSQYVFETVQRVTRESQAGLWRLLEARQQKYKVFHLVNALMLRADLSLAQLIAAMPEVKNIQPNPWTPLDTPMRDLSPQPHNGRGLVEWGVQQIEAPALWELGFRGQGIVVGGADTGVAFEHPAIARQYRGYAADAVTHAYHWHDAIREINPLHNDTLVSPSNNPCGLEVDFPCDDHNHGTHTVGTMVGDDGGDNQIGVAPEAQWIACRNMERGWGSPGSYLDCFNWFLAPTDLNGENPRPDMAPHVINNSWACPPVEGCNPMNFSLMNDAVNALDAAGILVVVSAGNSGPNCETVSSPAAIFENSFVVGASNNRDSIATFSSRGAVAVDSSFRLKPNVVAPGVGVRSAVRNGGYSTWNGTSMAGPHVAGAAALLLSALPEDAHIELSELKAVLENNALHLLSLQDCPQYPGQAVPNATYGWGRIDVLEAWQDLITLGATQGQATALSLQIFPNPAKNSIGISAWPEGEPRLYGEIIDATGKTAQWIEMEAGQSAWMVAALLNGYYTLRLRGDSGRLYTARFVVAK